LATNATNHLARLDCNSTPTARPATLGFAPLCFY